MDTTGQVLKIDRLELPVATRRSQRIQAAKEDKSMAALACGVAAEGLKKKGAKP